MSLVKFRAQNHRQQVAVNGAKDEVDDRGTDPAFFNPLNEQYGFTIDVAAAAHNAKCERYYDREADGLAQSWAGERVWCNPPYSNLGDWLAKAWAEWHRAICPCGVVRCTENDHLFWPRQARPELIVMLLPANRTEQKWWQKHVEPYRDRPGSPLRVEFLAGRLRFIKPGKTEIGPNERPPFGCCLLTWEAQ